MATISKERVEEINQTSFTKASSEIAKEMYSYNEKLREIEEKSKCLRVQFLDWLSDKLLNWSNRCHEMSVRIDSPCVIKVEPRKREESQHAKESKQITRLKELLEQEKQRNKGN